MYKRPRKSVGFREVSGLERCLLRGVHYIIHFHIERLLKKWFMVLCAPSSYGLNNFSDTDVVIPKYQYNNNNNNKYSNPKTVS